MCTVECCVDFDAVLVMVFNLCDFLFLPTSISPGGLFYFLDDHEPGWSNKKSKFCWVMGTWIFRFFDF